jgi:hypothetical protein
LRMYVGVWKPEKGLNALWMRIWAHNRSGSMNACGGGWWGGMACARGEEKRGGRNCH